MGLEADQVTDTTTATIEMVQGSHPVEETREERADRGVETTMSQNHR